MARGEPVNAYPNWDPQRRALILHSDRDSGSSYDDVALPALDGAAIGALPAAKRRRQRPR